MSCHWVVITLPNFAYGCVLQKVIWLAHKVECEANLLAGRQADIPHATTHLIKPCSGVWGESSDVGNISLLSRSCNFCLANLLWCQCLYLIDVHAFCLGANIEVQIVPRLASRCTCLMSHTTSACWNTSEVSTSSSMVAHMLKHSKALTGMFLTHKPCGLQWQPTL